ncbi:hypothetical protein FRC17_010295 [Serendipita sp. 399]|nr:hypothetical protein FRC17_010295 [Serendipita sp. 399]
MIEQATRMMLSQGEEDDEQRGRISYRQAPAEDLGFLDDRSVDFISAGSDPERIQRAVLVKHLGLSRCIPLFRTLERRRGGDEGERPQGGEASEGPEPSDLDLVVKPERDSLSAYWEQPGRAVLDGGLVAVPHPSMVLSPSSSSPSQQHGGFGDGDGVSGAELGYEAKVVSFSGEYRPDILRAFETLYRTPTATTARMGMEMQVQVQVQKEGVILVKEMDWEGLERYLRTWSSCSTYLERFPEEKERRRQGDQQNAVEERGEGEGDIVQRFLRKLKREMERTRGREERLVIEWPLTLLLYHKRSEQRTE